MTRAPLIPSFLHLLLAAVLLGGLPSIAADAAFAQADQQQQVFPGPFEATPRYRVLADDAADAEAEITSLADVQTLEDELENLRQRIDDLREVMDTVDEQDYVRVERLSRLREQALQIQQRVDALRERSVERLEVLDQLRADWRQQREFWSSWRQSLEDDPRLPAVQTDFRRAEERIVEVIQQADAAMPPVLEIQQESARQRAEAERLAARAAEIRLDRREALLERREPLVFTAAFFSGLAEEVIGWRPISALLVAEYGAFARANLPLMLLHLLLIVGLAILAQRFRSRSIPEGAWSGLLLRPRALAVFTATALLTGRYEIAPALWDVIIWALLAGSAAVLATRLVRSGPLRGVVYFFAALYPLFLLAEAVATPPPVFRLGLGGVAVAGLVLFAGMLRREVHEDDRRNWIRPTILFGALVLFVIVVAEILGFYMLARWILHAAVRSAYVVFVVALVIVIARGAIRTLVRMEADRRQGFLQKVGYPLIERLLRVLQIVLVVVAGLHILDIWEIAPSPAETWGTITGAGFMLAGMEITIGRIITAGIFFYLAILFSWVLRTFTRSEVYPRWELERGVGDSINSLVHYVLILLGLVIALGALGVELQNFAIVAGALGVGIGFGLQNIVNNFVSGLILLFERPVRVGDTVVMGSELGTIKKIGLRSTTVLTFDQAEVIVPNADLVSEKVTNWTLTDPVARLILPVGVAYGTDVTKVLELLRHAATTHKDVLSDPPPQALFTAFGDSALEFELRVWVQELRFRLPVRSAILAEIDRLFRENDIEIPFPQRDLHLRSIDGNLIGTLKAPPSGASTGDAEPGALPA